MKYWRKEDLKGLTERPTFDTHLLINHRSLIFFFFVLPPNNHKNRDLDVNWWQNYEDQKNRHSFQTRHELSSDVMSHWVTLQILYSFHLVEWNFEYMFCTTARFVWCMIILVGKSYNICNKNNTCTGRLILI